MRHIHMCKRDVRALTILAVVITGVIVIPLCSRLLNYQIELSNYRQAVKLSTNHKWEQAVSIWESLGDFKDSQDRLLDDKYHVDMQTAHSALKSADYDWAIQCYKSALGDKPRDKEAEFGCKQALRLKYTANRKRARELRRIGDSFYARAEFKKAIDAYDQAIAFAPSQEKRIASRLAFAREAVEQERRFQEEQRESERLGKIAERMNTLEGTEIQIAVTMCRMTKRPYPTGVLHVGDPCSLSLYIHAYNNTMHNAPVNPHDFSLSESDGYTVSHSTATYAQENYFDAVNLPPGGRTSGWIVFKLSADNEYTLHYNGISFTADKQLAFPKYVYEQGWSNLVMKPK